jgi:uncharacterized protein (DUF1778 family)
MARISKGNFTSRGATLSVRITKDTRDRLDQAAAENGVSLTDEVEARLRRSFEADDSAIVANFGHPQSYAVLRLAAEAIKHVEALAGVRRYQSRFVHDAATEAVATVLHAFRPKGRRVPPASLPVMKALDAYPEHRAAVRKALADQPWGAVIARTVIALTQAAHNRAGDHGDYGKIADKLGARLTRPVLPLPKNGEEESHNARITRAAREEN